MPLRKKGGIFIKLKFFLILIMSILITNLFVIKVNAETTWFFEGNYLDGIYMSKYQPSTQTTYYQTARTFREINTMDLAYCIEPFAMFNGSAQYESTINPYNLSQEQIDRISKIAYFGYRYGDHHYTYWYAVTQLMIWQVADPSGDYYFTKTLNGERTYGYQKYIDEINYLVDTFDITPSFSNQEYTIVENQNLVIEDNNNQLGYYRTENPNIRINGNTLETDNLKAGEYNITLYRYEDIHNKPQIFYQTTESQNVIKMGDIAKKEINLKINVIKTEIEINKIDNDNESIIPQGEASLDGAKYNITNENNELVDEAEIIDNSYIIENIPFGKYTIQEIEPGEGYTLDEEKYEVNITKDNPRIQLILKNKVIEKDITIHKTYGDNNLDEENISFDIYNTDNEKINTITTNNQGNATITLPYGTYTIKQVNTTDGYYKTNDIEVSINDTNSIIYEINDKKIEIEVPNTHTTNINIILFEIIKLLLILC